MTGMPAEVARLIEVADELQRAAWAEGEGRRMSGDLLDAVAKLPQAIAEARAAAGRMAPAEVDSTLVLTCGHEVPVTVDVAAVAGEHHCATCGRYRRAGPPKLPPTMLSTLSAVARWASTAANTVDELDDVTQRLTVTASCLQIGAAARALHDQLTFCADLAAKHDDPDKDDDERCDEVACGPFVALGRSVNRAQATA